MTPPAKYLLTDGDIAPPSLSNSSCSICLFLHMSSDSFMTSRSSLGLDSQSSIPFFHWDVIISMRQINHDASWRQRLHSRPVKGNKYTWHTGSTESNHESGNYSTKRTRAYLWWGDLNELIDRYWARVIEESVIGITKHKHHSKSQILLLTIRYDFSRHRNFRRLQG